MNAKRYFTGGFGLVLGLCFGVCGQCRGAIWNLTDADFRSRSVQIDSIDKQGIHTSSETVPWEDVLEIWRTAPPQADTTGRLNLCFRTGDKITGEPASFNGDAIQWNAAELGPVAFSVDSVAGIVRSGYAADDLDEPRTDDVVRLANGDTTHGIVTNISPSGVTMQAGDATPTLPWDSISAVLFSSGPGNSPSADRRMFRVHLTDNESFIVPDIGLSADQFAITLDDKTIRQIDPNLILEVEQLNGPIGWLTSRKPASNVYKPMFSENFPARFDRTVGDDRPISEKFPGFHHGIGCHSYSKLTYDLTGKWAAFRTQFAIDSDSPLADVTARIYLDDKPVYEQKNVKAGRIWDAVTIPLHGAKTLSLEVDYGENYATEDRFVWLDPALIRKLPDTTAGTTVPSN